jgi:hypothetical protein
MNQPMSRNKTTPDEMFRLMTIHFKYFFTRLTGLTNAPFQNELDEILSDEATYRKIAIAYARDHGKSTHLSIGYPLWEIGKNHNLRILLVSSTSSVTQTFMTEIIGHIEKNETYKAWSRLTDPTGKGVLPQFKGTRKANEKWSGNSIIIDREDLNLKDPTINAVGLFGSILSKRADIIIVDDLVNQVNSMTEDQRLKVIDWFYTTIFPVLVPGGRIIYLGNTWHQDDLVARLLKDPQFDYRNKRAAIIHESNHPELWQTWASILLDESLDVKIRKEKANIYYEENKARMEEGVEVLWPARWSYRELYLKRLSNSFAFERMYQCDPSNRPNQAIKDEWIDAALEKGKKFRLQEQKHQGLTISMSCSGLDLAISEEEFSDDTVLLTLDKILYADESTGAKSGDFIIRNIKRGKMSPNTVRLMLKDHLDNDDIRACRVETVGYQDAIRRDMVDMGYQNKITGYHTGGEKNDASKGVNSLSILLELGQLILPSDPTDPNTCHLISMLANEMRAYPEGHTGDSLMALWFAYSEWRDRTGNQLVIPSTIMETVSAINLKDPTQLAAGEKKADEDARVEQEWERSQFNAMMNRAMRK